MAEQHTLPETQQQISVHAQYVRDLSFESPAAPDCFVKTLGQPDVQIEVNVASKRVNEALFEIELRLAATAKIEEMILFVTELAYAGLMSATNINDDKIQPLMMIEGPRLLFPFARAILSDATRDGGFLPLNLNPIDFIALYRNNVSDTEKKDKKQSNPSTE